MKQEVSIRLACLRHCKAAREATVRQGSVADRYAQMVGWMNKGTWRKSQRPVNKWTHGWRDLAYALQGSQICLEIDYKEPWGAAETSVLRSWRNPEERWWGLALEHQRRCGEKWAQAWMYYEGRASRVYWWLRPFSFGLFLKLYIEVQCSSWKNRYTPIRSVV